MEHGQSFGWCFIGCGTLAHIVAGELVASGRHRIASVFGRSADKAADFAEQFGGKAYASAEEAMRADGVDGVYIVTTHDSHFDYARRALLCGKNVLCEKPMTMTAAESKALFALAEERGLYIAEAMWTWFNPVANTVRRWLGEGRLGTVRSSRIVCHTDGLHYAPRVTDPMAAGGAVLDMGVYALTYCQRLFGSPASLRCVGDLADGIDRGEEIELCYAGGMHLPISMSVFGAEGGEFFEAVGDKGVLTVERFHEADSACIRFADGSELRCAGQGNYLNEFDLVAAEMRTGQTDSRYEPRRVTVAVMEQIDECRRQMGLIYPFEAPDALDGKTL